MASKITLSSVDCINEASLKLVHSLHGKLLPGITQASLGAAKKLLVKDARDHHVFFNERRFHNHLNHHLLAALTMGASEECLERIYNIQSSYLLPALPLHPNIEIGPSNFDQFLGEGEYYPDWVLFFMNEIKTRNHDWVSVVSEYFFHPKMFNRMMSGYYHPFIQVGYGIEFESDLLIAQGLAQGCVHRPTVGPIFDNKGNLLDSVEGTFESGIHRLTENIKHWLPTTSGESGILGKSIMSILEEVQNDQDLTNWIQSGNVDKDNIMMGLLTDKKAVLLKYALAWHVAHTESDLQLKMRELYSATALCYGATVRPNKKPRLDFFLMHGLTSAYFLPIFMNILSHEQQCKLLRAHWGVFLAVYIAAGRPKLYLDVLAKYGEGEGDKVGKTNPWLDIFNESFDREDPHVVKVVRSLWRGSAETSLDNVELDTARATMEAKGYNLPPAVNWEKIAKLTVDNITYSILNEDETSWEYRGVGNDEAWEEKA